MSDIYIYVAASGVDLDDRDSQGHTRPNLPRHHKQHTLSNSSHALNIHALVCSSNTDVVLSPEWW